MSKFSKFKRKVSARKMAAKQAEAEYWKKVKESDEAEFTRMNYFMQAPKDEQRAIFRDNIQQNITALSNMGLLDDCNCCICRGVPCPHKEHD